MLKRFPGAQVDSRLIHDDNGVPNGFMVQVKVPLRMAGNLVVYFACGNNYPASRPNVEVEVDGDSIEFDSEILRTWSGQQYLIEIVREVKKRFEY